MTSLFGINEKLVSLHGYDITKVRTVLQGQPLPTNTHRAAKRPRREGVDADTTITLEEISDAEVRQVNVLSATVCVYHRAAS